MSKVWTDEQIAYLLEHYADNTAQSVGVAIGRTTSQVHKELEKQNAKSRV